jgi:hypothetical protein
MRPDPQTLLPWGQRWPIGASLVPPLALLWLASRHGWVPLSPWLTFALLPAAVVLGALWPAPFRGWHRGVTRVQHALGRALVTVLLALVFLLVLVPTALVLRLRGRSFLETARRDSYWQPARPPGSWRDAF